MIHSNIRNRNQNIIQCAEYTSRITENLLGNRLCPSQILHDRSFTLLITQPEQDIWLNRLRDETILEARLNADVDTTRRRENVVSPKELGER